MSHANCRSSEAEFVAKGHVDPTLPGRSPTGVRHRLGDISGGSTERRRIPRRPVADNLAYVEWTEGSEFHVARVRLLDVSNGGARIAANRRIPLNGQVWVRLEQPTPTNWVSARVVWVGENLGAGLQFCSYCPHQFFVGDGGNCSP
jgi:hypothetical protein